MRLVLLALFIAGTPSMNTLIGQSIIECGNDKMNPSVQSFGGGETVCGYNWNQDLLPAQEQRNHMPGFSPFNPSGSIRTIRVNLNVWYNPSEPNAQYADNAVNRQRLRSVIEDISEFYYTQVDSVSDPVINGLIKPSVCDSNGVGYYGCYPDSKVRLQLDSIHFVPDSIGWSAGCGSFNLLSTRAEQLIPGYERRLNINLVQRNCCIFITPTDTASAGGAATDGAIGAWAGVPMIISCAGQDVSEFPEVSTFRQHWAHEIGHVLGLKHTYGVNCVNESATEQVVNTDSLSSEDPFPCSASDFLSDVFRFPQPWCTSPPPNPQGCHFSQASNCLPFASNNDGCTNNIMGNNFRSRFISPLQMGRIHRSMMLSRVSKCTWGYDTVPYVVNASTITLNGRYKFYQDIIVPSSCVLTVKCIVEFVPEARIIVMPGGKLVIDGGVVRAGENADQRWRGIEVWGDPGTEQIQDPLAPGGWPGRGLVELRNGGSIEDADIGILVGSRDQLDKGGGVVIAEGLPDEPVGIRNCGIGISFKKYPFRNKSVLKFIRFGCDNELLSGATGQLFQTHALVDRADVTFEACSFIQERYAQTSQALGQGIVSMNSKVTVKPVYASDCPTCITDRVCVFKSLDHGMELLQSDEDAYATVHRADFANNICGIYANGMTGFAVTENQFTVGDNPVELTGLVDEQFLGYHRAFFSTISYGFVIRDNTLVQATTGEVQPLSGTEGIVVGYTRDHNDVVFRNQAFNLERAYVGEGVCADVLAGNNYRYIGLQFLCNTNSENAINFWSRMVPGVNDQNQHTIRGFQGFHLEADNRFDRSAVDDRWDFRVTTSFTPITYTHRTPFSAAGTSYVPLNYDPQLLYAIPSGLYNYESVCRAPVREPLNLEQGDGFGLAEDLLLDKTEYASTKYLYDQLVDGGSTDEVVQEISSTWPNEAWELRQYLLDLSPFLSTLSLKEAVNKPYFPMAMKAEVCIANPDATQKEGFIRWLELDANEPMPTYLIELIQASWDTRTFRTEMELDLADQHTSLSQGVNELIYLEHQKPGTSATQLRWAWQQIRTTAARYAEAILLMSTGDYVTAFTVIDEMTVDNDLMSAQVAEQQRMLSYITLLSNAHGAGRDAAHLNTSEVAQLQALRANQFDRPANWISNLLCMYYADCRAPRTGGDPGGDKRIQPTTTRQTEARANVILIAPNPTQSWATVTYTLLEEPTDGRIVVKDLFGRVVITERMAGTQGQVVLDTRPLSKGVYTVECTTGQVVLRSDRLVVQ